MAGTSFGSPRGGRHLVRQHLVRQHLVRQHVRQARDAAKQRKGRKKARSEAPRLPPIVPLVLSHAPSGWTAARRFGELLEGPAALLRAVRPMTPDFAPLLEDLTERTEEELRRLRADSLTRLEFR